MMNGIATYHRLPPIDTRIICDIYLEPPGLRFFSPRPERGKVKSLDPKRVAARQKSLCKNKRVLGGNCGSSAAQTEPTKVHIFLLQCAAFGGISFI